MHTFRRRTRRPRASASRRGRPPSIYEREARPLAFLFNYERVQPIAAIVKAQAPGAREAPGAVVSGGASPPDIRTSTRGREGVAARKTT
jgi:hypothetical protein